MCNIMICEKRRPKEQELLKSYQQNPDGIGIAWLEKDNHCYLKGISLQELKKLVNKLNLPFVIHFRLATHGNKTAEMCHPFIVTKQNKNPLSYKGKEPLLFHNGVDITVFKILHFLEKSFGIKFDIKDKSDTYCIAKALALSKDYFETLNIFSGKFVLFYENKIYRFGHFFEENGILNSSTITYSYYPYYWKKEKTDFDYYYYSIRDWEND